jgi:hypothetical protein
MDPKRIYILGAGSSIGHSKRLFPSITGFFDKARELGLGLREEFDQIEKYAGQVLGQPLLRGKRLLINIESLFTHIEIEIERKPSPYLLAIRQELFKLIQDVLIGLEEQIRHQKGEFNDFVSIIAEKDTIITFNWDILLDNILDRENILSICYGKGGNFGGHYYQFMRRLSGWGEQTLDGISIRSPYREWNPDNGYYLKVHGSIDWFFCSNESCRGWRKTFPLLFPAQAHYCSECHEPLALVLIPPVLNKEYRQYPIIRRIWNLAAKEISSANELIIWGYSLPPTDFYGAWLIRQARQSELQRLVIIDPSVLHLYKGKEKCRKGFISRFYDNFRDKIKIDSVHLYESFGDYCKNYSIKEKYHLGSLGFAPYIF